MPAPAEKEAKKGSFLKDVRNAAIVTALFLAYMRGHDIRMAEQQQRSVPNVNSSTTSCVSPSSEPALKTGESIVVYRRTVQTQM